MPSLSDFQKDTHRLLKANQSMAALRAAEQSVREYPASAEAHYLHASVQERVARYEESLHSYRRCLELGGYSDAAERMKVLSSALERPEKGRVPTGLRSWHTELPLDAITGIQNALHNFHYKDVHLQKNPFDYALYPMLLWKLKPRTIIEIGSKEGGSALWMAELCDTFKLTCDIHSIDIVRVATVKHKRITFHEGDGRNLGGTLTDKMLSKLPHPWLVIEDADHSYETSMAVLDFFEGKLELQDMMVVEDGIISELSQLPEGTSGPHRALKKFLQRNFAEWEIRSEWCDFFGYNLTWSSNGFLQRTGRKKLELEVAPSLPELISQVKKKEFSNVLHSLAQLPASPRGARYLAAYCHYRSSDLEQARACAAEELKYYPDHYQARRLYEMLSARLDGTLMAPATVKPANLQPSVELQRPFFINLGCGRRFHNDWLNLDIVPADPAVFQHNLLEPLPLDDSTCGVVYHSHVLEHIPKEQAPAFIAECFRVLTSGGTVRIAVPDLEGITREYLKQLDAGNNEQHEWMTIELVDQLTRHRSGGHMLDYWKQNPMPAEGFVLQRMGREAGDFISDFRSKQQAETKPQRLTTDSVGSFRLGGEVHQWMYDRLSLGRLLAAAGFTDIRVCKATESAIPDFVSYHLDTDEGGNVRKPDSLFMEATKP